MTNTSRPAFAAFRNAVFDDVHLMRRVREPRSVDAYVADVAAVGATKGFIFDASDVLDALRTGQQTWAMQGVDFEP